MSISPDWCRMMAAYNTEMNRRLYESAGRLDDAARREDRGSFWGSIHGTLAHLVWGDRQWMSRFDGWAKNTVGIKASNVDDRPFDALAADRADMDRRIEDWTGRIAPGWLDGDFTWFSGAANRELSRPLRVLVTHFFNHQTHHRGQIHAMLTAAGEKTGDTDLMILFRE